MEGNIDLNGVHPFVQERFRPFLQEILNHRGDDIHSIYLVGSAVSEDFDQKTSDINSIVVLREMKMDFLRFIAPLGKRFRKKSVAAPLLMTPDYISHSLDTFPVEFLNFKIMHKTVYGDDILSDISISPSHLRIQCEREIKVRTIALRQGYISSMGKDELLRDLMIRFIPGIIPLMRAIIFLLEGEPPILRKEVLRKLAELSVIDSAVFEKLIFMRSGLIKPAGSELHDIFVKLYKETERLEKTIDELTV